MTLLILVPWEKPDPLTRTWCLYEIANSNHLEIALNKTDRQKLVEMLLNNYGQIMTSLCEINIEKSDSWWPDDVSDSTNKNCLFEVIRSHNEGFNGLNSRISRMIRQWLITLVNSELVSKEKSLGEETSHILHIIHILAHLRNDHGLYDEAKVLYEKALVGREKILGAEHPDTVITIKNFAYLLLTEGDYNKANALHEKYLKFPL
jgi:hypothetical protein